LKERKPYFSWLEIAVDNNLSGMKHRLTLSEIIQKNILIPIVPRLPITLIKLWNRKPIQRDGHTMDPLIQFVVSQSPHEVGHIPTPKEERRDFDIEGSWLAHNPEPTVKVAKWAVNGPNGNIPCEIHRPKNLPSCKAPALMFFHGGGHVSGSLESHRNICRQFAHELNCAVVAVDYRLAPEHKFPIGINDCLASFDAVTQHADELGLDPKRISIGGDSAGGNITAVIAQQRKSAVFPPKFQALWAPWVDMSKQTRSYEIMGEGFFLEKKNARLPITDGKVVELI
jgi:acetyl esterase